MQLNMLCLKFSNCVSCVYLYTPHGGKAAGTNLLALLFVTTINGYKVMECNNSALIEADNEISP